MASENSEDGNCFSEKCDDTSKPLTKADYFQRRKKEVANIISMLELQMKEKNKEYSRLSQKVKNLEAVHSRILSENENSKRKVRETSAKEVLERQRAIIEKLKEEITELEESQTITID